MRSDDIAISARNVTKTYRLFGHPNDRIKQFFALGLRRYHREFTALQGVSFDIGRGETIGIVGRNGSGKSTLLQLISGILKPTSGSVTANGRVSALLELGAGFNPEFTGRENVYFQGAIMGLSKAEMEPRFDAIATFADIGEFIHQPVRTYSSGMFVRLAFSVAVHVEPDILLIDEVLAVGDAIFQQKCFDRIYQLQSRGVSIIVVSHNPYQIERLCHRAAVMRKGSLSPLRPARETLSLYRELVHQDMAPVPITAMEHRDGTHDLHFEQVFIEGASDTADGSYRTNASLRIVADMRAEYPLDNVRIRFELCSATELIAMISTIGLTEEKCFHGRHRIAFNMPRCQLTTGRYHINAVAVGKNIRLDTWQRAAEFSVLLKDETALNLSGDNGIYVCQGDWEIA